MSEEKEGYYSGQNQANNDDQVDIKSWVFKILAHWPYFLVSIPLCVFIAFMSNRYATNIYQVSTVIHINEKNNPFLSSNVSLLFKWGGASDITQSNMAVLRALSHNKKVIKALGAEVTYKTRATIKESEIYKSTPLVVIWDTGHVQLLNRDFKVEYDGNKEVKVLLDELADNENVFDYNNEIIYGINGEEFVFNQVGALNEWFETPYFKFKLVKNTNRLQKSLVFGERTLKKEIFAFNFKTYDQLVKSVNANLTVKQLTDQASIIQLTFKGSNKAKLVDYLNTSIDLFREHQLYEKNTMARNTIRFIDAQIATVRDTLLSAQSELEQFQASKKLVDLTAQAQMIYQQYVDLEAQEAELETQKLYFDHLKNQLQNERDLNNLTTPVVVGISDPAVIEGVSTLIGLSQQRARLGYDLELNNPIIQKIDEEIRSTSAVLLKNVTGLVSNVDLQLQEIQKRINKIEKEFKSLPASEQMMVNIKRKYTISSEQYTFLLERRSEAGIVMAANVPDNTIIDRAQDIGQNPIAPLRTRNLALGLMLGMTIPVLILLLREFFNNKVDSKLDLEKRTVVPVIGMIGHNAKGYNLVVNKAPHSSIAESFRSLRTNIQYVIGSQNTQEGEADVILVTSSVGGEGKTFTSANISSVFAKGKNKTVIIGCDLRKPKIYKDFSLSNDVGVVNFLVGQEEKENIIQTTNDKYLDFIASGPVPPNPSELLMSEKMSELIAWLKTKYDYIVLDTPPLGLVVDARHLMMYSNINLYMVRQDYTKHQVLEGLNDLAESGRVKDMYLILNDAKIKRGYGYGYGYGSTYGYGYAYGYGYGYKAKNYGYYGKNDGL